MSKIKQFLNFINKISSNQTIVLFILLCQLMFTTTIMLFTERMCISGKVTMFLIALGSQMALLSSLKKPGIFFLILIPKIIIDAFQFVLLVLFGNSPIAVDMFLNLTTTNTTESTELLSNIFPALIFLIIFYGIGIALAIKSIRNKECININLRKKVIILGTIIFLLGMILIPIAKNSKQKYIPNESLYPYNVVNNMFFASKEFKKIKDYKHTSNDFKFNAVKDSTKTNRQIIVLVLGETERAANYGLLGYTPNNCTPLDTIKNIAIFSNVLTQSNTTHKIVPMIFSAADAANHQMIYSSKSIIAAFKESGFKTAFFTNQKYNKSFPTHYFKNADYKISLKDKSASALDHELLPHLDSLLQENKTDNLLILLHIYGSHFNYKDRYSKEFSVFLPDKAEYIAYKNKEKLINSYNNSILSTADFVANVIQRVDKQHAETALIYLSDHGEDLMDDKRHRFLHSSPIPTYYQLHIPFICWLSDEYIENNNTKHNLIIKNRNNAISNNVVFHSLIDLAGISTKYFNPKLSICRPKLQNGEREYLTDRNKCIKVKDLPMHKYDFEQFRKRNIIP